jgi:carbamoyltransferase
MRILGISALYHDSAAVLLEDGQIQAAAQEERFTRLKHDASFPRQAMAWCISRASGPVDAVVYYEKPLLKFERILSTAAAVAPRGLSAFAAAMPPWLQQKLWIPSLVEEELARLGCGKIPIYFTAHHEAHAASAFFPSPFARAAILTVDGVGEWATTVLGRGEGNQLQLQRELTFPHSLGLLYSAFTYYCGFRVNSGEYKLMGLAPYGSPRYVTKIRDHLIDLKPDGSFRLNLDYFGFLDGRAMTNASFHALLGGAPRPPEGPLDQRHCDLARSVQEVTEEVVLRLARTLFSDTGEENLCLAGGVALNCVANGRLLREGPFQRIWVQPAAGDAGGALGAAFAFHHGQAGAPRHPVANTDVMQGALLGPAFTDDEIEAVLKEHGLKAERLSPSAIGSRTAERLEAGDVVGFFQGRAEFGPRALGARSILADARSPEMQQRLNRKIKFRESFRPFAPVVLAEHAREWFELDAPSPYMLFTAPVAQSKRLNALSNGEWQQQLKTIRSVIPAVTHVDYSARVQTVEQAAAPELHSVLQAFAKRTGCPVLVNTSFNVRGEPPVCHPREAVDCFLRTGIDCLVAGSFLVDKRDASPVDSRAAASSHFRPD